MEKILYLEPDEEITSIIDRLKKEDEPSLIAVVPPGAALLSSNINLRLLKEKSEFLNKNLSLVMADKTFEKVANQMGFRVYESITDAKKDLSISTEIIGGGEEELPAGPADKEATKENITTSFEEEKEMIFRSQEKADIFTDEDRPRHKSFKNKPNIKPKTIALVGGVVIILWILATFLFPQATVYLTVYSHEEELLLPFRVATSAKTAEKKDQFILPAVWEDTEKITSIEFTSTGEKNMGDKAHGTLNIYNRSGRIYSFPAGTEFISQEKIFTNKETVTVPGALVSDFGELVPGKASFEAEAKEGGSSYNIKSGRFSIPLIKDVAVLVYGMSEEPMTGGNDRPAKVVTAQDLIDATEKAQEEAKRAIEEEFGIKGDKIFVKGLAKTETLSSDSSKKENEEAEKFTVNVKSKFSFLVFTKSDFEKMFEESLGVLLSTQEKLIGTGYRSVSWEVIKFDENKKEAQISAKVTAVIGAAINEDFISDKVAGLDIPEMRQVFSDYPDVEVTGTRFFPPFTVRSIPVNEKAVKVKIKYVEK
ncbi:hypothetical protein HYV44_03340 [Candidatus Microgenomates bacterium]|nr:hypothetical protein [Candidatus Microgenomates bacterium]